MTSSGERHEDAARLTSFETWIPLLNLAVGALPGHGNISGVYALRSTTTGEIIYIGSTNNLRRRVFGNYIGGVGGQTTQRVHELLFSEGWITDLEVAWIETDGYKEKEAELKKEYRKKYGHIPKWNKL